MFCIRWVDNNLEAHEEFIGLHRIPNTEADTLVNIIKDILLRLNLRIADARGQYYGGAASMAGTKSGVSVQFKSQKFKNAIHALLWTCIKFSSERRMHQGL